MCPLERQLLVISPGLVAVATTLRGAPTTLHVPVADTLTIPARPGSHLWLVLDVNAVN